MVYKIMIFLIFNTLISSSCYSQNIRDVHECKGYIFLSRTYEMLIKDSLSKNDLIDTGINIFPDFFFPLKEKKAFRFTRNFLDSGLCLFNIDNREELKSKASMITNLDLQCYMEKTYLIIPVKIKYKFINGDINLPCGKELKLTDYNKKDVSLALAGKEIKILKLEQIR